MEREIKFRLWNPTTNKMLDWNCLSVNTNIFFNSSYKWMQFTGLKDKNGKEIYEGDIINFHQFIQILGSRLGVSEGEQELKGVIEIDEMGVFFNCNSNDDQLSGHLVFFNMHDESIEVIGNIYENPELLS